MKKILVEQFDDMCVNKDGQLKIFTSDEIIEIDKKEAYELGLFLYKILDLLAPEVEEETIDVDDESDTDPKK